MPSICQNLQPFTGNGDVSNSLRADQNVIHILFRREKNRSKKKNTYIRLINCLEWQKCQQMLSATLQSMIVIPGEHWRYDDEDGGVGNVGVVLDVLESGMTLV